MCFKYMHLSLIYIFRVALVIDHTPDMMEITNNTVTPTSCAVRLVQQQTPTSVITVTTTVQLSTITVTSSVSMTPQSSCNCSSQQMEESDASSSSCNSDIATIFIPVVLVFGVILAVVVVVGIIIWRKKLSVDATLSYGKGVPKTTAVINDLYGLASSKVVSY